MSWSGSCGSLTGHVGATQAGVEGEKTTDRKAGDFAHLCSCQGKGEDSSQGISHASLGGERGQSGFLAGQDGGRKAAPGLWLEQTVMEGGDRASGPL